MQMLPLRDVPMEVRSLLRPETFFSSYKCLEYQTPQATTMEKS